jgi:hypothetical protein
LKLLKRTLHQAPPKNEQSTQMIFSTFRDCESKY